MRKLASLLLMLLTLTAILPTAVTAESAEPSVKLTVPENRVPLDKPFEITLELSGLDATLDKVVIGGIGFTVEGSKTGYYYSINASDLPAEAYGHGTYRKTLTAVWTLGDTLSTSSLSVFLQGDGYGSILENEEGQHVLHNPYSDFCWVAHNGEYIAFSTVSEEDAVAKLDGILWPWVVGGASVALLVTAGCTVLVIRLRKWKKTQNSAKT